MRLVVVEVGVAGFAGAAEVPAGPVPGPDVAVLGPGGPVVAGVCWWAKSWPVHAGACTVDPAAATVSATCAAGGSA